jgi:hypothetical protein
MKFLDPHTLRVEFHWGASSEEQVQPVGSLLAMMLRDVLMRTYILAIATAALFAIPAAAFSAEVEFGPGGVRIAPNYGHHRGRCAELRQACLHKEE